MGPFRAVLVRGVQDGISGGLVLPAAFRLGPVTVSDETCPGIRLSFHINDEPMNPRAAFSAKSAACSNPGVDCIDRAGVVSGSGAP